MKNLAGDPTCDRTIVQELERAGVAFVRFGDAEGEVRSRLRGRLGPVEFTRGGVYWIAEGPVPQAVALDLYANQIGRQHVRVHGLADRPPPERPWLRWYTTEGARVLPVEHGAELAHMRERVPHASQTMPAVVIHDDPAVIGAHGYIELYHIDSLDGLQVFTSTLRRHGVHRIALPPWWAAHHGATSGTVAPLSARSPQRDQAAATWECDTQEMDLDPLA